MGDFPVRLRPGNERDILACEFEIEHEDVLHLKNMYKRIYDWLVDEGYTAADGPDQIYETLYWERTKPTGAQEHHIWWRAFLTPRDNRYYRYFLKIDYQTLNSKKMEVMRHGQKFGTNKVDLILRIQAWLQLDYNDEWQKSFILSRFDKWFRTRFYLDNIYKYKKDLYKDTYRLHTMIKQYLKLTSIAADWGRPFHHPEKGVS
ncbi:hypothetical protein JW826_01060 [Candidatus Woesearchaeota archaeon]|nr:hypothetical protein [Candidatus Woesearchaeota archaeon]